MRTHVTTPHFSAGDNSPVSLAIVQASAKDQGVYDCCLQNSYGKATAEFDLTPEGKPQLLRFRYVRTTSPCSGMFLCSESILFCLFFQFSNNFPVTRILKVSQCAWGAGGRPIVKFEIAPGVNGGSNIPTGSFNQGRESLGMTEK